MVSVTSCFDVARVHLWLSWQTALLLVVDVLVVLGNTLVVVAVVSDKSLHTATNVLITSLALSDLFIGLFVLPFSISQETLKQVWIFGAVWCEIWLATDVWLCTASIYNLVVISFDRYMAITRPLKYRLISSISLARSMVATTWLISLVISLPPLVIQILPVAGSNQSSPALNATDNADCQCSPMNNDSIYVIYSSFGSFFVPLLLIISLNCSIYRNARLVGKPSVSTKNSNQPTPTPMRVNCGRYDSRALRRTSSLPDMDLTGLTVSPSAQLLNEMSRVAVTARGRLCTVEHTDGTQLVAGRVTSVLNVPLVAAGGSTRSLVRHNSQTLLLLRRRRGFASRNGPQRAERRVAKTVGVVVGCFVVCWLPFSVVYLLQAYDWCPIDECISDGLFRASFWFGYCNSALNPIIYALFSHDFRRAFRRVLRHPAVAAHWRPKISNGYMRRTSFVPNRSTVQRSIYNAAAVPLDFSKL